MARLPTPGSDSGQWGQLLNDFLASAHNTDGTLKSASVTSAIANGTITKTQLASAVQASLDNADAAVSGTAPDASTSTKGLVQLAGDLAGTATSPTVPGLAAKADTTAVLAKSANLSDVASTTTARTNLGLGTAATRNIPASGNASSTEVVYGSDTRLIDTRTPTDNSVTTAKIGDTQVTNGKLADNAVTNAKITDGTIAEAKLATAVQTKLNASPVVADGSITSAKIADGTIVDGDINASAAIAQSKIANLTTSLSAKYTTPVNGIPAGDLTAATQASLVKADTSVQSVNAVFPSSGNVTLTASDVSAIPTSQKGAASGVASLGSNTRVTPAQLPMSDFFVGHDGDIAVTTGTFRIPILRTGTILGVTPTLGTAPIGGAAQWDVRKATGSGAGSSIFASSGARPTIADGAVIGTEATPIAGGVNVAPGDVLMIDTTQIGLEGMAAAYGASGTQTATDMLAGFSVPRPAVTYNASSPHIIFACFYVNDKTTTVATPSGWTRLFPVTIGTDDNTTTMRAWLFYRYDNGASTWSFTATSFSAFVTVAAVPGAASAPIDDVQVWQSPSASTSFTIPAVSTTGVDRLMLVFHTSNSGAGARTYSAGFTGTANTSRNDAAYKSLGAASGPVAQTSGTTANSVFSTVISVLVKPAPGAAGAGPVLGFRMG